MSLRKQAVVGVKWNSISTAVTVLVQFVTLAILAHLLSPEDFGLMGMAIVITGLAGTLADFGLSNAIIYRQDATRRQLSSLYWFGIFFSWILWGIVWIITPLVSDFFHQKEIIVVLRGASLTFLVVPIGQQFLALLRRELMFKIIGWIKISEIIIYGFTGIFLALMGYGVMSLVWATVFRAIASTGLLTFVAFRKGWLPYFYFRICDLGGFAKFGLFQMGDRLVNYLGNNIDYLIIGRFLGAEALGYYTLAYNLMRVPQLTINPIIVSVAFPAFAKVQGQNDVLRRGYGKILSYLNAVTTPMMLGMFVVAPLFIPVVYGKSWLPAIRIVQIFCLLGIIKSLGNPISSILLAKGRADLGFYMNLIAVTGYTVCNILGVKWGIVGVATSSLLFTLVVLVPIDFYLRRITIGMQVSEFWNAVKKTTWSALVMVVVLIIVYFAALPLLDEMILLIALIMIGILIFFCALWYFDRVFLREIWNDIIHR